MNDVVVVHWPEEREEVKRLADRRVPRLLLVAAAADPPDLDDVLQDWVRLPGDERDFRARLGVLRQRAADLVAPPVIDRHGRLVVGAAWVQLSPIEEGLGRALIDAFGLVVSEQALVDGGWPSGRATSNALRVHLHRLRKRIESLGLEIQVVRNEGWVLQLAR
jgi:DNA-binding response OmpR family regulator